MTKKKRQRRPWGTVYQRGRIWWVAYTDPTTGRRVQEGVGLTKGEAEAVLRHIRVRRLLEASGRAEPDLGPTFEKWQEDWLADRRTIGRRNVDGDKSCQRLYWLPLFGELSLREMEDQGALIRQQLLDLSARGLAPRTVRGAFAVLRKCLNDAVAEGLMRVNPCQQARRALPPNLPKDPIKGGNDHLSPQEVERLLTYHEVPEERRAEYAFAVLTGVRKGAVRAIQLQDVFLDADIPHVVVRRALDRKGGADKPTKTSAIREVALHPQLISRLRDWIECGWEAWVGRSPHDRDVVFPRADGTKQDLYGMKVYRRDLESAECHRITYHDLRHTLGTLLRDAGVPRDNIGAILGHKDRSTTAIYAKVTLKLQREELSKLQLNLHWGTLIQLPNQAQREEIRVELATI